MKLLTKELRKKLPTPQTERTILGRGVALVKLPIYLMNKGKRLGIVPGRPPDGMVTGEQNGVPVQITERNLRPIASVKNRNQQILMFDELVREVCQGQESPCSGRDKKICI